MSHPQAYINPDMLQWARTRAGMGVDEVARAVGIKPEQLERWELGETFPTFRQAQGIAHALHTPFGFFFLPEAPKETPLLPDLRTIADVQIKKPSANLIETIKQALQRQAWYIEYQKEQGQEQLSFVKKFKPNADPKVVARDIRSVLEIDIEQGQRSWEEYHRELIRGAEKAGILVMRSGIVGNNTRRKLDVSEFRGFAISDPIVPVVFINAADAPAARLFTLIHELAHLWFGCSGISDAAHGNTRNEEIACNAVAGEFLVPSDIFIKYWNSNINCFDEEIAKIARLFHVSKLVIIRRALDLKLIDKEQYNNFYFAELERFRKNESKGGSFYRNVATKNSRRFSRAVISEALSGRLLLRDAGKLLGVQPAKIRQFAEQLGT